MEQKFKEGDYVIKPNGYSYPGQITHVIKPGVSHPSLPFHRQEMASDVLYIVARWSEYKSAVVFSERQLELSTVEEAVDPEFARLRKEMQQAQSAQCPQPISSAPKDGRQILLFGKCIEPIDAGRPTTVIAQWSDLGNGSWVWYGPIISFTHWAPLTPLRDDTLGTYPDGH